MALTPDELNDGQARHAVQLFYDHTPTAVWQDGKPSVERVNTVVRALSEQADPDDARVLAAMMSDENREAQAALARVILKQALATPALAESAQTAIDAASQGNMMLDPVTGLLIIGMLLVTTKFDRGADGSFHVELSGGAKDIITALKIPDLLQKLPAVIKAVPAAILQKLV